MEYAQKVTVDTTDPSYRQERLRKFADALIDESSDAVKIAAMPMDGLLLCDAERIVHHNRAIQRAKHKAFRELNDWAIAVYSQSFE